MHLGAPWIPALPALPLLGALALLLLNRRLGRLGAGLLASATVGLSFLISLGIMGTLLDDPATPLHNDLYTWISALDARVAFTADTLSASMAAMVSGVGLLIHIYSIGYMDAPDDDPRCWRYFAVLNGFVASMLVLVLASDLFLLFVGWEGVGLCSYLLIGFWFSNEAFAAAGRKAFLVNRVGDLSFVLGLVALFWALGAPHSLAFASIEARLTTQPQLLAGGVATLVVLLLLGGAVGKSAQIPLYVWLPDAMAGPTPVSALIHAATMVTAGVYLLLRLHFLLVLSPTAMGIIALMGAVTALWAALLALTPTDIKKVLAYSTISQLGFMFMAVGLGAWVAALFHLLTHAFFKALLFLGAGSLIHALRHQQDMRKMGGLRRRLPLTFTTFLAGYLAIVGFPGFSGFFSKDEILWRAFTADPQPALLWGGLPRLVWALGVVAALLTAFYMSRLLFRVFFGHFRGERIPGEVREPGQWMAVPLAALATLALAGGALELPHWVGSEAGFLSRNLSPVFAGSPMTFDPSGISELAVSGGLSLGVACSVTLAWALYLRRPSDRERLLALWPAAYRFIAAHGHVDTAYRTLLLRPLRRLATDGLGLVERRLVMGATDGVGQAALTLARVYRQRLQQGRMAPYLWAMALGAAALVGWMTLGAAWGP